MCLVLVCASQCFRSVIFQRRLVVMGHIERDEHGSSTCMGVAEACCLAVSAAVMADARARCWHMSLSACWHQV